MTAPAREAASVRITQRVVEHPSMAAAHTVLAYASFGSEVQTRALLESCLRTGRRLVLPRVNRARRELDLHRVCDLDHDLAPGTWGISEPRPERCEQFQDLETIDLVIVPGAAFTADCARMGYGGGFYDRLLGAWRGDGRFVAVAFDEQIVDTLPLIATDVRMHEVVTPSRHFRCDSRQDDFV